MYLGINDYEINYKVVTILILGLYLKYWKHKSCFNVKFLW